MGDDARDAEEGKFAVGKVNANLKSDVESVLAKGSETVTQKKRHEDIVFSENVPIFPFLGLSGARVVSDASRVRNMVKKHHLTTNQIADLPNRYGMPVAIMKDGQGFVALTDMIATSDHGDSKPVFVALNPKILRSGEVVFLATAMAHDAKKEFDYYQSRIRGGLLYADINKAAGLGLEEETESILRTQAASNGDVKTPAEFTAWSTAQSIPNSAGGAQGGGGEKTSSA